LLGYKLVLEKIIVDGEISRLQFDEEQFVQEFCKTQFAHMMDG
jgi:hypothetical protein